MIGWGRLGWSCHLKVGAYRNVRPLKWSIHVYCKTTAHYSRNPESLPTILAKTHSAIPATWLARNLHSLTRVISLTALRAAD